LIAKIRTSTFELRQIWYARLRRAGGTGVPPVNHAQDARAAFV